MKISDIAKELNLSVISGEKGIEREVSGAYVSDLLSDVRQCKGRQHMDNHADTP